MGLPAAVLSGLIGCVDHESSGADITEMTDTSDAEALEPEQAELSPLVLESWPGLTEDSERILDDTDLRHYVAPESGFESGHERRWSGDGVKLSITLVELGEAVDSTDFLDRQIAAWRANSDIIASEEIEVPELPDARGLRFASGVDWVRVFALQDVYAIDISVRNNGDDVDALGLATQVMTTQLDHLTEQADA